MKIVDKKKFIRFLITLFAVILVLIITIFAMRALNNDLVLEKTEEYTVQSGETLWSIASSYRPNRMSIQEYIFNLKQFNHIGSIIYPNQKIEILIYKEMR